MTSSNNAATDYIPSQNLSVDTSLAFKLSPYPILIINRHTGRVMASNPPAQLLFDYTNTTASFLETIQPLNTKYPQDTWDTLLGKVHDIGQWKIKTKGNEANVYTLHVAALVDDNSQAYILYAYPALQPSEIDTIFDMREEMQESCFVLDTEYRFTYANSKMLELVDKSKEELLGQSIWALFPGSRESSFYEKYATTMEKRIPVEFEEYSPRIDRWLRVSVYPDKNGIIIYGQDVSQIKKITHRLKKIAWYQSHLVRGPLASILGLVRLFDKENLTNPFNAEIIDHLETVSKKLDQAVSTIVQESTDEPIK